MLSHKIKTLVRPLIIISSVILLVSALNYNGSFFRLEGLSQDWRMTEIRSDKKVSDEIAVIMIDDASLNAMDSYAGRWPWPRYVYADLLEFLSLADPKGVLFDITFTEKQAFDAANGETISTGDDELVIASASYPFAYHAMRFVQDNIAADENSGVELNKDLPFGFKERFAVTDRQIYEDSPKVTVKNFQAPLNNNYYVPFPELTDATQGIGVVEVQADQDSIYRRARLFHNYQNLLFPALSITALLDDMQPRSLTRLNDAIAIDQLKIPVDSNEKVTVNYYGNYNVYSFSGIIASLQAIQNGDLENLLIDPAELKDKFIFVGGSAAGLNDLKNTPIDARLPGVFIHASLASNILTNDFLTPSVPSHTYALIVIFTIITSLCVLFLKNAFLKNGIPLVMGLSYVTFVYYLFGNNIIIEMVAPLSALSLSWAASFSALVLMEGREKRKFKKMMSQYLSPAVLSTVVDNHEEFAKAEVGSKENITMLFSDIRSFTNMSEKLEAEQVVEMLNHYFSSMTDSIFHYEGTIDKFIGDAIMAFWGAPIKSDDHADKATRSAIDMIRRLEVVNQWIMEKGLDPIAIGIGVHTGDAILGNIGSESKLDYTIIGDNVNLASRIEGLTKHYGASILITEDTYNVLSEPVPCFTVDLVKVKGKNQPIKVYQPLILPENPDETALNEAKRLEALNTEMFEYYVNQDWHQALKALEKLPKDKLHDTYRERCQAYLSAPPQENWDGVHTMTTK